MLYLCMEIKKSNAGRKTIEDKKVIVNLFVKKSVVEKLGKEQIQKISYEAIEKKC